MVMFRRRMRKRRRYQSTQIRQLLEIPYFVQELV
jgi:hypothetical protein